MNYELLEKELKKRLKIEYNWGRKQNNEFDKLTKFIYSISLFNELEERIEKEFSLNEKYNEFKNYALNRWFNFWSANAVEQIFCEHQLVKAFPNSRSKFIDFHINTIPFDHKTTVFPKGFKKSVPYAFEHKKELLKWLYQNQSQQQRKHLKNRIFIVLVNYNDEDKHWKLKAEIGWLKKIISSYLSTFDIQNLETFNFQDSIVTSDIIWAIK